MKQLLNSVTNVAGMHKTTSAEVVKAVARLKKTGLKITNAVRNPRKQKLVAE